MNRTLVCIGAILGAVAVVLGAWHAHGLEKVLNDPVRMKSFHSGVEYQFYHTFALLAAAWVASVTRRRLPVVAGWLFIAGIALFSGGVYLYALTGQKIGAHMAPFGGLTLIVAWLVLAVSACAGRRGSAGA